MIFFCIVSTAASLNNIIKNTFVPELEKSTFEGDALPVPTSLPWYADATVCSSDIY